MLVRLAVNEDLPALREIERDAGRRFRDYGLDEVADDEPASIEVLRHHADDGRVWVAVGAADAPLGYILIDLIGGAAHIEQVSVAPSHQGRGIGRALIEQVGTWARSNGISALTLTTFGHIPWNRPLYEHLGFQVLSEVVIDPELRAMREREAEEGLDPDLRVVMRLDLSS